MDKQKFFLFRRKSDSRNGYEYIQHIISASHDAGLTVTCYPEYAWRTKSNLEVKKMKYLISISKWYNDPNWELVQYLMEVDIPSWANKPEHKTYEDLCKNGEFVISLSESEALEFENWKKKADEKYSDK